jgi:outer membrane usher protein
MAMVLAPGVAFGAGDGPEGDKPVITSPAQTAAASGGALTNGVPVDLFQKAFGEAQDIEEGDIPLELMLDGERLGELPVALKGTAGSLSAEIQAALLFERLKGVLNDETEVRLRKQLEGREQVTPDMLEALGWGANVDLSTIQLVLRIPPEQRKARKFRFMRLEPPPMQGEELPIEELSAYANLYVSVAYDYGAGGVAVPGFDPVSLRVPAAVRFREVVFEADVAYLEGAQNPAVFERARFVYDQPESRVRWTIGDVFTTSVGYQRSVQVGGISVGRQWSLQPYSTAIPQGEVNLLLNETSEVEIWANGRLLQRFTLNPGQYSFADFPLVFGENNVEILLRDRSGRVQVIQQNVVYDRRLLAAGLVDWALTLGVPSEQVGVFRRYASSEMQMTGYFRRPLGEAVTGGVNTQANAYRQMTGVDALWVNRMGAVTGDVALSRSTDDTGYAMGLGYRAAQNLGSASFLNAFNASVQYRSQHFDTLGQQPTYIGTGLSLGLGATVPIPGRMRLGLVGSQSFGRGRTPDVTSAGVNLGKRFRNGLDVRLTANWSSRTTSTEDWSVGVVLTYIPPGRMTDDRPMDFYRASGRYPEEEFNASWQRTYGSGVGASTYGLDWQSRKDDWNQTLQARFFDERAIVGLSHAVSGSGSPGDGAHRTRLNVGTALVYAGGHFAVSQPVNDSFVMVRSSGNGEPAPYFGSADGPVRSWTSDWAWLGSRVDVRQSSYLVNEVRVYPPKADETGSLEVKEYGFRPKYRSGTFVDGGFAKSIGVVGRLVGADGSPMVLRQGRLVPMAVPDKARKPGGAEKASGDMAPLDFVTGPDGEFQVPDVRSGQYEIELIGETDLRWQVGIGEGEGTQDLGTVQPANTATQKEGK